MEAERTIRRGELTEQALVDAVATERQEGRRPTLLAVGSKELELAALRILSPSAGGLDDLRSALPNVVLDRELPGDGWELRS